MPPQRSSARRKQVGTNAGISYVALPFLFPFVQPALLAFIALCKESPMKAASRKYPYTPPEKAAERTELSIEHSNVPAILRRSKAEQFFVKASSRSRTCDSSSSEWQQDTICDLYVKALTEAYSCKYRFRPSIDNMKPANLDLTYHRTRRRACTNRMQQSRSVHNVALKTRPSMVQPPSREEYLQLVEIYSKESYSTHARSVELSLFSQLPVQETMSPQRLFWKDGSCFNLPEFQGDFQAFRKIPHAVTRPSDDSAPRDFKLTPRTDGERRIAETFLTVLNRSDCTHEQAFAAYSSLPNPGLAMLHDSQIRLLFERLSVVQKKTRRRSFQFMSVVDDMKSQGLQLTNGEWNSAIAFCGQTFTFIQEQDVEIALKLWKEMEQEAKVKAGIVTFNILFDMAAKAGKFVLAELILKEMETRGLELNRYSRVSKIYFYGLRGDTDGIYEAYRELVNAGEVVDTVVLNCVIASLIAAGEPASAEHVYRRMKKMLVGRAGSQLKIPDWRSARELGRLYDHLARERRSGQESPLRRYLDEKVTCTPDLHTYTVFIEYHVNTTGDLQTISALLGEMKAFDVPLNGRIFLKLFKGFTYHGTEVYTDWTPWRLRRVYDSLLKALDQKLQHVEIQRWMVIWAVRAFHKCAGRKWASFVWQEMKGRWKPGEEDLQRAAVKLADIIDSK